MERRPPRAGRGHRVRLRRPGRQPHRVGKPQVRELAGLHSARRGPYRLLYRIDDADQIMWAVSGDGQTMYTRSSESSISSLPMVAFGQEFVHGGSTDAGCAFDGAFVAVGRELADEGVQFLAQRVVRELVPSTSIAQGLEG